jgi:tRNA(fMet)-specific endonuclease VapC
MYLLDTDVIIYSLKGNPRVVENFARQAAAPKAISVITFGELIFGARTSQHVQENLAKVYRFREMFPIIDITPAIMECFGEIKAEQKLQGISVADLDLMIGATALTMGYRMVTNNVRHFSKIPGLTLENWTI